MVSDQNEAEEDKQRDIACQSEVIATRKEAGDRELVKAEPALKASQAAVKGVKKSDLDEVRNILRPTSNVKVTLECVATNNTSL